MSDYPLSSPPSPPFTSPARSLLRNTVYTNTQTSILDNAAKNLREARLSFTEKSLQSKPVSSTTIRPEGTPRSRVHPAVSSLRKKSLPPRKKSINVLNQTAEMELVKRFYNQPKAKGNKFCFPPEHNFDLRIQNCSPGCLACFMQTHTTEFEVPIDRETLSYSGDFSIVFPDGYPRNTILSRRNNKQLKRKLIDNLPEDVPHDPKKSRLDGFCSSTSLRMAPSQPFISGSAKSNLFCDLQSCSLEENLTRQLKAYCTLMMSIRKTPELAADSKNSPPIMSTISAYIKQNKTFDWLSRWDVSLSFVKQRELHHKEKSPLNSTRFKVVKEKFGLVLLQDTAVLRLQIHRADYEALEEAWLDYVFSGQDSRTSTKFVL